VAGQTTAERSAAGGYRKSKWPEGQKEIPMIQKPNALSAAALSFAKFVGYSVALALLAGLESLKSDWRAWAALGGVAFVKSALTFVTTYYKPEEVCK
jgi:hypothetical protein